MSSQHPLRTPAVSPDCSGHLCSCTAPTTFPVAPRQPRQTAGLVDRISRIRTTTWLFPAAAASDASGNPYFTFAAMLMAGIDGIKNKIDPGEAMDKDLYDLPDSELKGIPTVSSSLREALDSLDKDRDFLKAGNVFTDNLIDAYISLKMDEVLQFEHTPLILVFDLVL